MTWKIPLFKIYRDEEDVRKGCDQKGQEIFECSEVDILHFAMFGTKRK